MSGRTILTLGAGVAAVAILYGSPGFAQGPRTVSAQRFVLMSPGGQAAGAVLQFTTRGPELSLLGPGERTRARIGVDQGGGAIELVDERGDKPAALAMFDGEPAVVLDDAALKTRAIVSIAQDRPAVVLLDENRRPVFRAP
jgi:hypothetical protein